MLKLLKKLTPHQEEKQKKTSVENFFDYSASEKKKIIKKATHGANRKQRALIDDYNFAV